MEIESLLIKIKTEMETNYSPPLHLFNKFDLNNPNDNEHYGYIQNVHVGGYYHWLALLVRYMKPRIILELGSRYGISTVMLYSELPVESQLISVDLEKDQRYVPDQMWEDKRVKFIYGNCLDLSIYNDSIPCNIDIFWTDTIHSYEQIRNEFEIYEPLLSDESIIVIDDINLNDKKRFFDEIIHEKFDLTTLCHSSGFGVIHYSRKNSSNKSLNERKIEALMRSQKMWSSMYDILENENHNLQKEIEKKPGNGFFININRLRKFYKKSYKYIYRSMQQ